jgi:hypothetical protein
MVRIFSNYKSVTVDPDYEPLLPVENSFTLSTLWRARPYRVTTDDIWFFFGVISGLFTCFTAMAALITTMQRSIVNLHMGLENLVQHLNNTGML